MKKTVTPVDEFLCLKVLFMLADLPREVQWLAKSIGREIEEVEPCIRHLERTGKIRRTHRGEHSTDRDIYVIVKR